ncbi:MAG: PTS IIA-like nitrogen regulatory protein PtsN [Gammaproteobacteria bacterium]
MIAVSEFIKSENIVCKSSASSKKRTLEALSELLAYGEPGLDQEEVFESLCERERLGSTGLGHGVAIPHGRIQGLDKAIGAFMQLETAVDFDAIDGEPVDLICALLVPEKSTDEHLNLLALLAEMFSDIETCKSLRSATAPHQIFETLVSLKQKESQLAVGPAA